MTPRFLRDEASRFRGMADSAERESSRLRLLAMAADYESRATVADKTIEPDRSEAIVDQNEPSPDEATKVKSGRKTLKDLRKPALAERQPDDGQG